MGQDAKKLLSNPKWCPHIDKLEHVPFALTQASQTRTEDLFTYTSYTALADIGIWVEVHI